MNRIITLLALLTMTSCNSRETYVAEAGTLTRYFAESRLSRWNVRVSAAGHDCAVLLVETTIVLEDSMVDAMHNGTGAYDMYDGGVGKYAREHAFRGVTYRDRTARLWNYGDVTDAEAEALQPCR